MIVGRQEEQQKLKYILESKRAEFVVVYGRRRVGKTFLIREYFNDCFSFYTSGIISRNMKDQLYSFNQSLIRYGCKDTNVPKNWFDAFEKLRNMIEDGTIKLDVRYNKRIIFIDELPWFNTAKSDFKGAFDFFWNTFASRLNDLVLITCGSATSWIMDNLLNDKGGFHNRVTARILLRPFNLNEVEQLVNNNNGNDFSKKEIIDIYMVFGGIPYYLNLINTNFSLVQNIDNIFFKRGGELEEEYNNLFSSLFFKYENHTKVIEALATKRMGLSRNEIIKLTNLSSGFSFSKVLLELEQCGFIRKYRNYQKNKNDTLYQIIDPFILFSLAFLKDRRIYSWNNYIGQPGYYSWSGYAFEIVCLNHVEQIKDALGIRGIGSLEYSFFSNQEKGAQIDLLIDRQDNVINLCEIKYNNESFSIDYDYEQKLNNKVRVFREATKTKKAIDLTFISLSGIEKKTKALVKLEIVQQMPNYTPM